MARPEVPQAYSKLGCPGAPRPRQLLTRTTAGVLCGLEGEVHAPPPSVPSLGLTSAGTQSKASSEGRDASFCLSLSLCPPVGLEDAVSAQRARAASGVLFWPDVGISGIVLGWVLSPVPRTPGQGGQVMRVGGPQLSYFSPHTRGCWGPGRTVSDQCWYTVSREVASGLARSLGLREHSCLARSLCFGCELHPEPAVR